jgi:ABC-type lipoprotein release transport system permease subunit
MFAVILAVLMRSMQLGSYERMIENSVRFYTGHIQIHQKGYWDERIIDNSMSNDGELIALGQSLPEVEVVVPRLESFVLAAYGTKTRGAMLMGVDPVAENGLTSLKEKLIEGEYLDISDNAVLVSEGLAKYLKIAVGDTLTMLSQGYHGSSAAGIYPVKGIVKFPISFQNDQSIFIPLPAAQWFFDAENLLSGISLMVDKPQNVAKVVDAMKQKMDLEVLEIMDWEELSPELVQGIEIDNISGKLMLYILYLVIGFGMLGTFMMMTAERQYEFGVMISIGMSRLMMQVVIALEMVMMTFLGLFIGVGISLPFLIYYHFHPIKLTGDYAKMAESVGIEAAYYFSLDPELFFNQALAVLLMAAVLGFYPIYFIHRLKPVKAMREA